MTSGSSENQIYRLKWNKESTASFNLAEEVRDLRENAEFFDVSLSCSASTGGSFSLPAHKVILSAYSAVFREMFRQNSNRSDPFIYMSGVSFSNLSNLLDFIYDGEASVPEADLKSFLALAEELQIKGMKRTSWENTSVKKPMAKRAMTDNVEGPTELQRFQKAEKHIKTESMKNDEEWISENTMTEETAKDYMERIKIDVAGRRSTKWKCRVCGYISRDKTQCRRHLKRHKPLLKENKDGTNNLAKFPLTQETNLEPGEKNQALDEEPPQLYGDEGSINESENEKERNAPTKDNENWDEIRKNCVESLSKVYDSDPSDADPINISANPEGPKDNMSTMTPSRDHSNIKEEEDDNDEPVPEGKVGVVGEFIKLLKNNQFSGNKKRPMARCRVCLKELRRDKIKPHIRGAHPQYLTSDSF